MKICVICKGEILPDENGWDGGHNAMPARKGKCCNECNDGHVTFRRLLDDGFTEYDSTVLTLQLKQLQ